MSTKSETKTSITVLSSKLKVDNILQFNLIQTTLQDNFKAILQVLSSHDNDITIIKQSGKNDNDRLNSLQNSQDNLARQLQQLKDSLLKLQQQNQSLKQKTKSIQKITQNKNTILNPQLNDKSSIKPNTIQQIKKQIENIKQKINKTDTNIVQINKNNVITQMDVQKIKKQMAGMEKMFDYSSKIKQLQKLFKDMDLKQKQMMNKIKQFENSKNQQQNKLDQNNQNKINQLQSIINKLQENVDNFIKVQYKQNRNKLDDKLSQLEKLIQQNKASLQEEKRMRSKLNQQLWKVHDVVSKNTQTNFNHQLTSDTLKQLKRQITQLQRKINDLTSNKISFDTTMHESPTKYKTTDLSPTKGENNNNNNNNDLREQILQRLKQLKLQMLKNIKKIDLKSQDETAFDKKRLDSIDEAILRLDHILADKANLQSVNKLITHLENKISYIYNIFLSQTQEDATIAKKNWVCLSCDKKLDKYQGKIGAHLINAQLKSKTLEQETIGGGMLLRPSKSKVDLPKVNKKS